MMILNEEGDELPREVGRIREKERDTGVGFTGRSKFVDFSKTVYGGCYWP